MEQKYQYNTVEEAIRDLQDGKIILVTDDPDRENEGDMICAAQFATRENINFMATHAKGLICTPMSAEQMCIRDRVGVVLGKFLHAFIIDTVEVDTAMFGRNINFSSYMYSLLFTILFSLIVNGIMYFKLKKIDMVESLKSIE